MSEVTWRPTVPIVGRNLYQWKRYKATPGDQIIYIKGEERYDSVQVWSVVALRASLVCDATVANRNMRIQLFGEPTNDKSIMSFLTTTAITASQTKTLKVGQFRYSDPIDEIGDDWSWGINHDTFMIDDQTSFQFYISNGVAGDAYDVTFLVRYMNPFLGMKFGDRDQGLDFSKLKAFTQNVGSGGSILLGR